MTERVQRFGMVCPTEDEHVFEIATDEPVLGFALGCSNCVSLATSRSPADSLTEMAAIRRRTIAGVADLPVQTRADLDATGTLVRLYQGTVVEVRDEAERCSSQFGADLPAALREVRAGAADRVQVGAALDATIDWAAGLTADPRRHP